MKSKCLLRKQELHLSKSTFTKIFGLATKMLQWKALVNTGNNSITLILSRRRMKWFLSTTLCGLIAYVSHSSFFCNNILSFLCTANHFRSSNYFYSTFRMILCKAWFTRWYQKYATGDVRDILSSWLVQFKGPFFFIVIFSASNYGILKILSSRCNALLSGSQPLFGNLPLWLIFTIFISAIPLTHKQEVGNLSARFCASFLFLNFLAHGYK